MITPRSFSIDLNLLSLLSIVAMFISDMPRITTHVFILLSSPVFEGSDGPEGLKILRNTIFPSGYSTSIARPPIILSSSETVASTLNVLLSVVQPLPPVLISITVYL